MVLTINPLSEIKKVGVYLRVQGKPEKKPCLTTSKLIPIGTSYFG